MAKVHAAGEEKNEGYGEESWLQKLQIDEVLAAVGGASLEERDTDAGVSGSDKLYYFLENAMSVYPSLQFWSLGILTLLLTLIFGVLWTFAVPCEHDCSDEELLDPTMDPPCCGASAFAGTTEFDDAVYTSFEVIVSGGYNSDVQDTGHRLIYMGQMFSGLVIFGIFVGFIADSVTSFMESLSEGKTKVVSTDHTLVLGWNESTPRLICQIAFLRRAWRVQNETFMRTYLRIGRVPPSTPVAKSRVVILSDKYSKQEMDEMIQATLSERGISPKRTRVGWDIICRNGDPTNVHDLVRAGTQSATSIVLMLSEKDTEELELSNGKVKNGGTIAGLLALRHVLFSSARPLSSKLRVTVQMSEPSEYADAAAFHANNAPCVQLCDLSVLLNSLMFNCASSPGLSKVLLELLNFDGVAFRARDADTLNGPHGVGSLVGLTMRDAANAWMNGLLIGVGADVGTGGGFVGDASRVIKAKDRLLFIAAGSMPATLPANLKTEYAREGKKLAEGKKLLPAVRHSGSKKVLVCGWRPKWNYAVDKLAARVDDLAQPLTAYEEATIVFLNLMPTEDFAPLMAECGFAPAGPAATWLVGANRPGVKILHVQGDATQIPDMKPLLAAHTFGAIIVLGTAAGIDLPPHSRDLRVLSVLLLLRHLLKDATAPVHIIGENQEDATSVLALPPALVTTTANTQDGNFNVKPDFINTQAIIARALCQSVAFPKMTAAVNELFSDAPGTSNIVILPSSKYSVPVGGPGIAFGTLCQLVGIVSNERDHCLGWLEEGGEMVLVPNLDFKHTFNGDEQLVIMTRRVEGEDEVAGSPGHTTTPTTFDA